MLARLLWLVGVLHGPVMMACVVVMVSDGR